LIPNLAVTAFEQIEAVRIWMYGDLDCELAQDAAAVSPDESEERSLDLKEPSAGAIFNGEVEK